jgi:hypothetical protein
MPHLRIFRIDVDSVHLGIRTVLPDILYHRVHDGGIADIAAAIRTKDGKSFFHFGDVAKGRQMDI